MKNMFLKYYNEKFFVGFLCILMFLQSIIIISIYNQNSRYLFPYAHTPIVIKNKILPKEIPHRENLNNLFRMKKYFTIIIYSIKHNLLLRYIYIYISKNRMMKNFNSLTAKVSLNNLFNAHHIFGLYAFRINIYDDDLIKSPQVFKLNLYGDNLTTGIFAGRYMQSIMYNISHIVNKNNQGIELSIGELNYLKKLLKFYHKKFVNQSIKSIEIQVSPISYDNNKKKPAPKLIFFNEKKSERFVQFLTVKIDFESQI